MKKLSKASIIIFLLFSQSCYFGAGLVEKDLTAGFSLFANNSLEEMSIWYHEGEYSNSLIIPETVFAVGYNKDFIIAKSHPRSQEKGINKSVTYFHIIDLNKEYHEQSKRLSYNNFKSERSRLNIPDKLDFNIVFKELE